jgi:amino acid adenylation domain-containing protein
MVIERYSLSNIQQGMAFHHLMQEHSGVDIEQIVIEYETRPDLAALERSWRLEVQRQPVLRTAFRRGLNGEFSQEVENAVSTSIHCELGTFGPQEISRFLLEDRRKGFALEQPPLMRLTAFTTTAGTFTLVWTVHHILLDGRSFIIVLNEVEDLYGQILCGNQLAPPPAASCRAYIEYLDKLDLSGAKDFWGGKLKGLSAPTPLPADPQANPGTPEQYGDRQLRLTEKTSARLREVAASYGVTLNTIVMSVWGILLSRYGGGDDLLFGVTKTTRRGSIPDAESMVGLFLNTIPIRMTFTPDMPVKDVLQRLRSEWVSLRAYEHSPLVKIKEASGFSGNTPLFESLVVFENQTFHASLANSRPQWHSRRFRLFEQTNYPLTFLAYGDPEILLKLEFDLRRYSHGAAERILEHAHQLFEGIAENPEAPVSSLNMLPEAEARLVTVGWNATALEYPRETPLAQLVEAQVERTPDAVAVIFGDESVTYRQLNRRANQLARELVKFGAGPDQPVGVCLERSIDMIAGLLAVIKAGSGYVPLDPYLPPDRLAYMIEDSGLRVLLSQRSLRADLPPCAASIVEIDDPSWKNNTDKNLGIPVAPEHLAYFIYTSGSTGKPKGVELTRGNLTNLLYSMRDWLQLTAHDCLLAVTTISFDIAGVDVWLPLLVGARTVVVSREDTVDGERLQQLIQRHSVTFLQATPVTWWLLLEAGWQGKQNLQIVCTGEAMPRDLASRLFPIVRRLWNLYGPTETTIWSTGYLVRRGDEPVLIGRPVGNTQCYILDERLQPVPIGVVGELYLAGDGVGRGYHNRPELTAEKFVPDPFAGLPGARMYRTGDLARYLPDGNIECLGRTDHQVKIRGFRIELEEIESILKQHSAVKQAVVIAREDTPGDKRLVAYVVPSGEQSPDRTELKNLLKKSLPEYMIPADYVVLQQIPISPNGKIDRKALPPPVRGEDPPLSAQADAAPRNATEEKILEIFRKVLQLQTIGIHDDFFDRGGHSLKALRAILLLNNEFHVNLPPRVLFEAQTPAQLAALVASHENRADGTVGESWPTLIEIQPKGSRPPLFCIARPNVNALGFLFLSRNLGPDQPVYGLQKQVEEDPDIFLTPEQYRDLAIEYVHEIKQVQPDGPYYLTGFCQGGFIAFEIARQLDAAGQKVALLAMMDLWPEENTRRKWLWFLYAQVKSIASALKPGSASELLSRIRRKLSGISQSPTVPAQNAKHAGKVRSRWELYWPGPGFEPPVFSGKITVFRVKRQLIYRIRDKKLGWGDRAAGGVDVELIPGSHTTFLREPHVKVLAEKIRARLEWPESTHPLTTISQSSAPIH